MSVIMAYKTEDKIYLGADNRASNPEDVVISDKVKKIIEVNNNVAVAFAGYYKNQVLFEYGIANVKNIDSLRVEDIFVHIKAMYLSYENNCDKEYAKLALSVDSSFIIVGKNKKNECCIYAWSYLDGKLENEPTLTDISLFNPYDVAMEVCTKFYVKNIYTNFNEFVQKTVKDIAEESNVVSPSGDIWIYDIKTGKSSSEHFS